MLLERQSTRWRAVLLAIGAGVFPLYLSSSQYEQTMFVQSADLWGPMELSP